ncbi:hypothetical protein V6252_13255, partial [Psychrobacter proteolyticus]
MSRKDLLILVICSTQVIKWIFEHGVTDFEEMTNLSNSLRDKLSVNACVVPAKVIDRQ